MIYSEKEKERSKSFRKWKVRGEKDRAKKEFSKLSDSEKRKKNYERIKIVQKTTAFLKERSRREYANPCKVLHLIDESYENFIFKYNQAEKELKEECFAGHRVARNCGLLQVCEARGLCEARTNGLQKFENFCQRSSIRAETGGLERLNSLDRRKHKPIKN